MPVGGGRGGRQRKARDAARGGRDRRQAGEETATTRREKRQGRAQPATNKRRQAGGKKRAKASSALFSRTAGGHRRRKVEDAGVTRIAPLCPAAPPHAGAAGGEPCDHSLRGAWGPTKSEPQAQRDVATKAGAERSRRTAPAGSRSKSAGPCHLARARRQYQRPS